MLVPIYPASLTLVRALVTRWGTSIFLFFLILSVLPGVTQETTVFRIATVAGLMICVLVYGLYGVSGGNLNPAVSLVRPYPFCSAVPSYEPRGLSRKPTALRSHYVRKCPCL